MNTNKRVTPAQLRRIRAHLLAIAAPFFVDRNYALLINPTTLQQLWDETGGHAWREDPITYLPNFVGLYEGFLFFEHKDVPEDTVQILSPWT